MARVRIVKKPQAQSGLEVKMQPGLYGTNGNNQFNKSAHLEAGKISQKPTEVRQTLEPVDREDANLEAEIGETAVVNISGMPAHFKIGGKRHSQGGTPLNLPDNSFIFSDTAKMKIKDPNVLAQFGMAYKKGGYTPADISKKYDINKFRKILADPNSDDLQRKTAEIMIANYNEKLAKLALAQESVKGFPQGIPVIAMPYLESMEIDPSTFVPDQAQEQLAEGASPDADMGTSRYGSQVISQWNTKKDGGLIIAQDGYVGLGFSNDPVKEKKFAQGPGGAYYRKYAEALKSKNPKAMLAAAELINAGNIENSWQWIPWSDENKLTDLSQILREEAGKIIAPYMKKPVSQESQDMALRKKASDAFATAMYLRDKAKKEKNTNDEIFYDEELKKMKQIHPDYKGAHFWRQEQKGKAGRSQPYTGEYTPPQQAIFYNQTEGNVVNEFYDKYVNQDSPTFYKKVNAKKAEENKTGSKEAASTPKKSVDEYFPSDEELLKMSDEEVAKWDAIYAKTHPTPKKKEGGQLDEYQGKDKGSQVPQNETPSQRRARLLKEGKTSTGNKSGSKSGVSLTPEEEEERIKRAETAPEKYVSDEEYAELEALYKAAEASSQGDPNKRTKETLAFQKRYHELLPDEARRIIASEKDPTTKGKTLPKGTRYDLEANEDMMFGKRTKQYWQAVKKKPADKPADVATQKKEAAAADRGPIQRNPPFNYGQKDYAPWWLQDIVKTSGAAADLARVKRYLPWQATPEVRLPDATFYDPTRELAANAEQANIQTQGMAAFTGPQALSARSAAIQGQALKNAADIMGRYNNMNVQIANQLSKERTDIMNQASQNKANLDTQLFDKYTIANQQFDNAKNMARQNLRQSYIDAITNRAKTQALNTLYPNFYTDPITGGFVNKTGYANIRPTAPGSTEADEVEKLIQRFPGLTPDKAYDIIRKNKGTGDDSGDASGYLKAQGYT